MKKKGISLIVLSITILVMAILAATAIIALEDSGIIGRAKNTTKNTNYAEEYTRLTVIKNGILTDNLGTITVDEYITELRNKGLLETGEIVNIDGSKTVTTKTGFDITLSPNGTGDIEIVFEGYTPPTNGNDGDGGTQITPTLLKFSIDVYGKEYTFEDGMTWGEWYESEYCDKTMFIIQYDCVCVKTGGLDDFWKEVEYWDMDCLYGPEDITYYSEVDAKILPVEYIY